MSGFTPLLFAYVFTAVFLAGIVRGATGFGFSMIMIVLLTLFFPPAQVAPVILFWEVLASIGHLPFVYKQVHWKSLRWLALGVALGTPFGVYCLVSIPVDAMRLIINAVVLILTSMLYCGLRPKNAPTPPSLHLQRFSTDGEAARKEFVPATGERERERESFCSAFMPFQGSSTGRRCSCPSSAGSASGARRGRRGCFHPS